MQTEGRHTKRKALGRRTAKGQHRAEKDLSGAAGYGRRSVKAEYRMQSRGGKGVINYKTEKYGDVAALITVKDEEDIILISSGGIIIRIPADSISTFSRTSKGVRVMRVTEGDKLVTVTTAEREPDQPQEDDPAETGEGSDEAQPEASASADETAEK